LQGGAQCIAGSPEALHILHETEGARPRDFAAEGLRRDVGGIELAADGRAVEVDLDLEARAIVRAELGPGRAAFDANRLDDADVAPLDGLGADADLIERLDEGGGAAVENRN